MNNLPAILVLIIANSSLAQCESFYDGLENTASIAANGGSVAGITTFVPGVDGNGIELIGAGSVVYPAGGLVNEAGSIAVWFRRTSSDAEGGICQVGTLGQANSLGLFYHNEVDLVFEMRNDNEDLVAVTVGDALPLNDWTHIVATWKEENNGCHLWIFINGKYRSYGWLDGPFVRNTDALTLGSVGWWGDGVGVFDELRLFEWNMHDSEVYAEMVWSSNRYRNQQTGKPVSTGPVQVIGKSLHVNGQPFTVKGVGYQATPICAEPWTFSTYTDPAILSRDVAILETMNVNTIRTWAQPPDTMLLDAMYNQADPPIYTLVGYWVPVSGIDYADPDTIEYYENDFRNFIVQFKDHPGVLGWVIGNEVNLSLTGQDMANWFAFANRLAKVAYLEEGAAYHPTLVDNGGLSDFGNIDNNSDDVSLNYVDMWGQNTYFGWDAHCYFDYYDRITAKPLVFTEFGIDAWDNDAGTEYQSTHASYLVHQWRQIRSGCIGGTLMAYADEWWKDGNPCDHDYGGYETHYHPDGFSNEEWYGIVWPEDNGSDVDIMHPRQAYYSLALEFAYDPADIDRDGNVDLMDFAGFQDCYGENPSRVCQIVFDFDVNGVIDFADFERFEECYAGPSQTPDCR